MKYDVLSENWIPVMRKDGSTAHCGIRSLLEHAHELTGIADPSPMREYGIYHLLCAFLMDAFRPEIEDDIKDIADSGKFDMNVIDEYVETCLREGVSFNLFDEKRPFLQCVPDPELDKELKSVFCMDFSRPSGNAHVHFDHIEGKNYISADEAARQLCAVNVFCTAMTQGYPSTVNGAPPLFILVKGEDLFKTLINNCLPSSSFNIPYDNPAVFWKSDMIVIPKEAVAKTSVLYGMTFPCRRVRLIPEVIEGGIHIQNIFFMQGKNYVGYDAWVDPHVAYKKSDEKRTSLKPSNEKKPWRNIGTIMNQNDGQIAIRQYNSINQKSAVRVMVFGVVTSNASYYTQIKGELCLQKDIIRSNHKMNTLINAIAFCEQCAKLLGKDLQKIWSGEKSDKGVNDKTRLIEQTVEKYYEACKTMLLGDFSARLAEADIDQAGSLKVLSDEWENTAVKTAKAYFKDAAYYFGTTGRLLMNVEKAGLLMNKDLKKLKEKG